MMLVPNEKSTRNISHDQLTSLEPVLVVRHLQDLSGLAVQVVRLYARGTSVATLRKRLFTQYGKDVSLDLIAALIGEFSAQATEWQNRPLDGIYPIIYFDALPLKIWNEDSVTIKSVYFAMGVDARGRKDVLGLWIGETADVHMWLKVFKDLKKRGCQNILIAVMDDLPGFRETVGNVFPHAKIQICIVHLIRSSLSHVDWKERRALGAELNAIYQAANAEAAEMALTAFEQGRFGVTCPAIAQAWRRQWAQVILFFDYPPLLRYTVIYTSNAIESLRARLRKIVKGRERLPSDDAATMLLYLALRNNRKA